MDRAGQALLADTRFPGHEQAAVAGSDPANDVQEVAHARTAGLEVGQSGLGGVSSTFRPMQPAVRFGLGQLDQVLDQVPPVLVENRRDAGGDEAHLVRCRFVATQHDDSWCLVAARRIDHVREVPRLERVGLQDHDIRVDVLRSLRGEIGLVLDLDVLSLEQQCEACAERGVPDGEDELA